MDDSVPVALGANCPQLRSVRLSWCRSVTDAGLRALGAGCPLLERLDIEGGNREVRASLHLATVAALWPRLRAFAVSRSCCECTDEGVAALAAGCPELEELSVSYCDALTDRGVEAVAAHCKSFRSFCARSCSKLTDGGLVAVGAGCPRLTVLTVSECPNVTGACLPAIAAGCPLLTALSLSLPALADSAVAPSVHVATCRA